jgi:hypothetical protein
VTTPQPGHAVPVDLHYPEPQPPGLDLRTIIGNGRRIRRRRRLSSIGAMLAAFLAVGSVVAGMRGFTISIFPSPSGPAAAPSAAPIDALVAADPPATGKLTLISSWPPHWTTVAWATRRGEVCWASFRTPMQGDTMGFQCPVWGGAEVPRTGSSALSSLDPAIAPVERSGFPILGLTSPQAARVVLTAFGMDISARVVPLPMEGAKSVGVFIAWIRAAGGSLNSSDISSEVAYDQSGHVIAHASFPP